MISGFLPSVPYRMYSLSFDVMNGSTGWRETDVNLSKSLQRNQSRWSENLVY